jgi:hypothetical protein
LKLLVYEHVSGGGYAGQPLNPNVLSEGFGMLRCFTKDLKAAGNEVTVLLDARLSKLNPPIAADCIVPVFQVSEAEKSFLKAAAINDASYAIAPETDQTLESLVKNVRTTGKLSLNCETNAIRRVADKMVLYETLKNNGLCTPETLIFDVRSNLAEAKQKIRNNLGYPAVVKPMDGVSCGGLSLVENESQMESAVAKIRTVSSRKNFIAQEFIQGEAASVSLLCRDANALAISLNKQNLLLTQPAASSSYEGGAVPFNHPLKPEAFRVAERTVGSFPGLRGYVGVDLVLAENKPFVVDVNPRLTTSYVGLSQIADFNVAEAMVNAVLKNTLPVSREIKGWVYFSKVKTSKPSFRQFQKASQMAGVISPPFPQDNNPDAVALVSGHNNSMPEAKIQFEEAKNLLLNIINEES